MKKVIILLVILVEFCSYVRSQNEVDFKVKYHPETKYNNTIEQTSETTMTYYGSDDFLQKMKNKGVQNPTITNKKTTVESVFKTNKLTDGKNFPVTMEYVSITGGIEDAIPPGTIIYGHGSLDAPPSLDSIVSKDMAEDYKKAILQAAQSALSQISFPEKKVKIGEEFTRESPLSIPISADIRFDMDITTTYKLISISDGIANFDISQVYTFKTQLSKYNESATGSGKGQLRYDIANNFYLKYQVDINLAMKVTADKFSLEVNSKSGSLQTTIISPN